MKKTLILATGVIVAMASCTKETYFGQSQGSTQTPIVFGNANSALTKAAPDLTPKDHAEKLDNSFVVYGWKNIDGTNSVVFDHYNIKFVDGSAGTTPSNYRGWEYVGITPVNGTNQTGVTSTTGWTAVTKQTIKFWDNNADYYKFIAFSRGKGDNGSYATFSAVDSANIGTENPVYTASGSSNLLASVYFADLDSVLDPISNYNYLTPVTPQFKSVAAKIRVAFYENVPGYSIKSLKFLDDSKTPSSDNKVLLYVKGDGSLPSGTGKLNVFIDKKGKATAKFELTAGDPVTSLQFNDSIILSNEKDDAEPNVNKYMGRTSDHASYSDETPANAYKSVLPSNGVDLAVKVQYTLVSTDGKGEEIIVGPVEVVIPAEYTGWKSNYAYTYMFKITDSELEPITFNAVVNDAQEGVQETVTALQTGTLTTYAKDVNPTANSEYLVGSNIYIGHKNPGDAFSGGNLYTVEVEEGACQGVTEGSFANAMALINNGYHDIVKASESDASQVGSLTTGADVSEYYTKDGNEYIHCASGAVAVDGNNYYSINNDKITAWIIKDANNKKMTIAKASCDLSNVDVIAAGDAPDEKAVSGHFAKFTPTSAGRYAFEYSGGTAYKIIVVKAAE